jgi:sirohydrochlorin ferrochelatase
VSTVRAVVLIDHGSRLPEANAVVEEVAAILRARLPGAAVEVAHLELAAPDLAQAVARCVASGATEVVVQPFFLAPGRHSARDIPALAAAAAERHPGVSIRVGEPLGAHPALVDAVLDRLSAGGGPPRRA